MKIALMTVLLWVASFGSVSAQTPIQLNDYRQLFVDDYLVDSMQGVQRVVNQPRKHSANPSVTLEDRPWEGDFLVGAAGSVVYDEEEQLFKMWYAAQPMPDPTIMLYASSQDGVNWEKPNLGLVESGGSTANNIVVGLRSLNVIISPDAPPNQRYKGFGLEGPSWNGRRGAFSADGFYWNIPPGSQNIPGPIAGDDVITFSYDPLTSKYIAAVKFVTGTAPQQRRSVAIATSDDFLTWTAPQLVLIPDAQDDEFNRQRIAAMSDQVGYVGPPEWQIAQFYGMSPFTYEGMYVGMLQVLDVSKPNPISSNDPSQFKTGIGGEDGLTHIQLASSRDLLQWDRVGERQVFLPHGDTNAWDAGAVTTYVPPIVVGDELWIYYTSEGVSHSFSPSPNVVRAACGCDVGGVGLAKLRLDGWASMDAGPAGGTFTTKPFVFGGANDRLIINAEPLQDGAIFVEILDEAGQPLPGFGKMDNDPLEHDALRHTVKWGGESDVSKLAGKPIRLRFHLENAKLYSFVFKNS